MKKIICIVMTVLIIFALSGCKSAESEATEAFENMMNAFKTCDKALIDEFYKSDELTAYLESEEGAALSDAVFNTLAKVEYKVISAKELNPNAVNLEVEIKTIDFSMVVKEFIGKVTAMVLNPEYQARVKAMQGEEYESLIAQMMIECIEATEGATMTKTTTVTMIKGELGWQLGGNSEEFLGVLFENLSNAVKSLV